MNTSARSLFIAKFTLFLVIYFKDRLHRDVVNISLSSIKFCIIEGFAAHVWFRDEGVDLIRQTDVTLPKRLSKEEHRP